MTGTQPVFTLRSIPRKVLDLIVPPNEPDTASTYRAPLENRTSSTVGMVGEPAKAAEPDRRAPPLPSIITAPPPFPVGLKSWTKTYTIYGGDDQYSDRMEY